VANPRPAAPAPTVSGDPLGQLDAMARLARDLSQVVHVVVPRSAGVGRRARAAALAAGVDVQVDLMANTMRARFAPHSHA
jgi:hypothetical protein